MILRKKGAGGGGMGGMMMIGLLLVLVLGFMLCEEQKKNKKLKEENDKLKAEIEKLKNQQPPQAPDVVPKNECTENKGVICDAERGEACDGKELSFAAGANKICCEKCKTASETTPTGPTAPTTGGYPITYVGGDEGKTCAFQKGNACAADKYCTNDQWLKAKDTKTCCKAACTARVQHKDVDFGSPLGKTTVERFAGNRFGVWYGSGVGEGFVELGRPNYVEAKNAGGEKYEFSASGKKYAFTVVVNEAARIQVEPSAQPSEPTTDFDSCSADNECVVAKGDCCGCNQGGTARAINKNKLADYEASLSCTGKVCTQMMSTDKSCSATPKCVNGKCTLSAGAGPTTMEVSIENFAYKPKALSVAAGTTVKWTNNDNVAHTVTSDRFDSKTMQPGQSFSFTFNEAGQTAYSCTFHASTMQGTVAVT